MPSPGNQGPDKHRTDWLAAGKTLLVQVLVLLALAVAFIGYVDWSSDASWTEFVAASKALAPDPNGRPQSAIPVQAVEGQAACDRKK